MATIDERIYLIYTRREVLSKRTMRAMSREDSNMALRYLTQLILRHNTNLDRLDLAADQIEAGLNAMEQSLT